MNTRELVNYIETKRPEIARYLSDEHETFRIWCNKENEYEAKCTKERIKGTLECMRLMGELTESQRRMALNWYTLR